MTDRRTLFSNGDVADSALKDKTDAKVFVNPEARRINKPVVDLLVKPDGPRDRQLIIGQKINVLPHENGFSFVQCVEMDGFVGYLPRDHASFDFEPTHKINSLSSQIYMEPSFKSRDLKWLPLGAQIKCLADDDAFWETPYGFIPKQHVTPLDVFSFDPAAVAHMFLGTPYLWGGNSPMGLDCSGLVYAALKACGIACPGDADLQEAAFGNLPRAKSIRRNSLVFWKGHVAIGYDDTHIIHANAHSMSVTIENTQHAIDRILRAGDGPVTTQVQL